TPAVLSCENSAFETRPNRQHRATTTITTRLLSMHLPPGWAMTGSPETCTLGRRTVRGNKRKDSARGHKSETHSQTATRLTGEQIPFQALLHRLSSKFLVIYTVFRSRGGALCLCSAIFPYGLS